MSPTLLYKVIARSPSDVHAHRSAMLWHAGVAISQTDSFASLGMTNVGLFVGQDTSNYSLRKHTMEGKIP
jgi:hypothetical protein